MSGLMTTYSARAERPTQVAAAKPSRKYIFRSVNELIHAQARGLLNHPEVWGGKAFCAVAKRTREPPQRGAGGSVPSEGPSSPLRNTDGQTLTRSRSRSALAIRSFQHAEAVRLMRMAKKNAATPTGRR